MRLFCYYAVHTVKNQIKKLCKTWVAVFFAVCLVFGMLVGLGAAFLGELAEDTVPEDTEAVGETEEWTDEEVEEDFETLTALPDEFREQIVIAIVTVLFLVLLVWNILSAGKSGNRIFVMADVNLLFAAPMKPQSVLLFRLCTQLGTICLASLYLLFQLPNLLLNLEMSAALAWVIFPVFIFLLAYTKLVNILLFTAASTHQTVRRLIAPLGYGLLLLPAGGLALYGRLEGLDAILGIFSSPILRFIPVLGWLILLIEGAMAGSLLWCLLWSALLILGLGGLAWIIWHIRADFYEDALQMSSEAAELMQQAQAEGGAMVRRKKKDRGDRIRRDALPRGEGAWALLARSLYNRSRFALGGLFTKTAVTYLILAVACALVLRFGIDYPSLTVVALIIGGCAFFRSLGNPIATELSKSVFWMMPVSPFQKIWALFLSGTLDCALDMIPAFVAACLILGANPLAALGWMLFIVSVDLYSSSVGALIDLSLSVGLNPSIRSVVQIMFLYFGLLPNVVILLLGGIFGMLPLFAAIAALLNLLIGIGVGSLCPLFLLRGRR